MAAQHLCVKEDDASHSGLDPRGGHILRLTIVVINHHNYDNHDNNGTFDYNGKMLVLTMIVATSTMIREPDSLRATILALSMNLR